MIGVDDELLRAVGEIALTAAQLEWQAVSLARIAPGLQLHDEWYGYPGGSHDALTALIQRTTGDLEAALYRLRRDVKAILRERHLWVHALVVLQRDGELPVLENAGSGSATPADPTRADALAHRIASMSGRIVTLGPYVLRFCESGQTFVPASLRGAQLKADQGQRSKKHRPFHRVRGLGSRPAVTISASRRLSRNRRRRALGAGLDRRFRRRGAERLATQ